MKTNRVFLLTGLLAVALVGIGLGLMAVAKFRTAPAGTQGSVQRMRTEARTEVLKECTNTVVGLSAVIEVWCDTWDEQASNWTAKATVEHVTEKGGIERTNLVFQFVSWVREGKDEIGATLDYRETKRANGQEVLTKD